MGDARVEADKRLYRFTTWDWVKVEAGLLHELTCPSETLEKLSPTRK